MWVQWYANTGDTLTRFYVDGSNDGLTWVQIGAFDYGTARTTYPIRTNVAVAPGSYQYIRVRLNPGDYASSSFGGPGLYGIEPVGSDTIVMGSKVNWAHRPSFNTTVFNSGFPPAWNGTRYNDGFLFLDGTVFTGDATNALTGDYVQVDLRQARPVDEVILDWLNDTSTSYWGAGFTISYWDDDAGAFVAVTPTTGPTEYTRHSALGYTFAPITARFWRITNLQAAPGTTHFLFNQVLMLGTVPIIPSGTAFTFR